MIVEERFESDRFWASVVSVSHRHVLPLPAPPGTRRTCLPTITQSATPSRSTVRRVAFSLGRRVGAIPTRSRLRWKAAPEEYVGAEFPHQSPPSYEVRASVLESGEP